MNGVLDLFIQTVQRVDGSPWAPILFLIAFALACQGLPTAPFPVAGGILFGLWGGTLLNVIGFVSGSLLTFYLSRRWGHRAVARFMKGRTIPSYARRPGFWFFVVVRLTGFPPLLVANIMAGLSEMKPGPFAAASAIGVIPWSFLMAFLARVLWEALSTGGMDGFRMVLMSYSKPFLIVVVIFVAVVGTSAWLGRRYFKEPAGGGKK